MSIFQDVLADAKGVEEKLLGPTYAYYKNVKLPGDIGMSSKGTIPALTKNIDGLINYVEVLVTGKSKASASGGPMGNKFFLQTGAKCLDTATQEQVDRFIYVNNIPDGNIPFLSSGLGVNFSEFKGLIPGVMSDMNVLNPFNIMSSFLSGATPDCQEITLETVDVNNNKSSETHYVTLVDIRNMNACGFQNKTNPQTGEKCRETFVSSNVESPPLPEDPWVQLYFAGLSALGIYILYKMSTKSVRKH